MSSTGILPSLSLALGFAPASSNAFTTSGVSLNAAALCREVGLVGVSPVLLPALGSAPWEMKRATSAAVACSKNSRVFQGAQSGWTTEAWSTEPVAVTDVPGGPASGGMPVIRMEIPIGANTMASTMATTAKTPRARRRRRGNVAHRSLGRAVTPDNASQSLNGEKTTKRAASSKAHRSLCTGPGRKYTP